MTILILEDEQPAAERLIKGLRAAEPRCEITGPLATVREAVAWLREHSVPDLIVADIQLADGLSLDVFRTAKVTCPVIFATAYDEYWMEALQANGIDYLLKPFKQEQLVSALAKYRRLQEHFEGNVGDLVGEVLEGRKAARRRIVVRKGGDFVAIPHEQIAYCTSEHKVVFLMDSAGQRYLVDKTLSDLEEALPPSDFLRLNRQFIANIAAIKRFKPIDKGKIRVELSPPSKEEVIVSQENGGRFRAWIGR